MPSSAQPELLPPLPRPSRRPGDERGVRSQRARAQADPLEQSAREVARAPPGWRWEAEETRCHRPAGGQACAGVCGGRKACLAARPLPSCAAGREGTLHPHPPFLRPPLAPTHAGSGPAQRHARLPGVSSGRRADCRASRGGAAAGRAAGSAPPPLCGADPAPPPGVSGPGQRPRQGPAHLQSPGQAQRPLQRCTHCRCCSPRRPTPPPPPPPPPPPRRQRNWGSRARPDCWQGGAQPLREGALARGGGAEAGLSLAGVLLVLAPPLRSLLLLQPGAAAVAAACSATMTRLP